MKNGAMKVVRVNKTMVLKRYPEPEVSWIDKTRKVKKGTIGLVYHISLEQDTGLLEQLQLVTFEDKGYSFIYDVDTEDNVDILFENIGSDGLNDSFSAIFTISM